MRLRVGMLIGGNPKLSGDSIEQALYFAGSRAEKAFIHVSCQERQEFVLETATNPLFPLCGVKIRSRIEEVCVSGHEVQACVWAQAAVYGCRRTHAGAQPCDLPPHSQTGKSLRPVHAIGRLG